MSRETPATHADAEDIAIVGMSCIFPRASTPSQFWKNIVDRVDCVGEPPESWRTSWYAAGDSAASMPVYMDRGGYLGDLCRFDATKYGIMPASVDGSEPDQFLALRCAFEAMADAGIPSLPLNREKTAVIMGRGSFVNRGILNWVAHGFVVDQVVGLLSKIEPGRSEGDLATLRAELKRHLPPFHTETAAGVTPCIMVGRIANRLDLKGPNYTLDAACSSTLLAVEHGMRELRAGRSDAALVGGVQVTTPVLIHQLFCRIEGLSRRGVIAPLSDEATGTLLGEGCGMLVLKRRSDAERDGHRVYALIKAVGVSCDGRGAGLLAPRSEGQQLAIRRALEQADLSPSSIGLIEAHATGILLGDKTELESLSACFGDREGGLRTIGVGSVKSMIGHLLPASGAASLIKTALALYHRTMPPTLNAERPNPSLDPGRTPFYLSTRARPWFHGDLDTPRRAGVNAFGFGGINAHAILEESPAPDEAALARLEDLWPAELVVVSASDRRALRERAQSLASWLDRSVGVRLLDVAASCASSVEPCRLAVVASSVEELSRKLTYAAKALEEEDCSRIQDRSGIFWYEAPLARSGRVAFAFSGSGAQYPQMLAELCRHFPEARRQFDLADAAYRRMGGEPLSRLVFPLPDEAESAEARLLEPQAAMTSVMAAERALLGVLAGLGVRADAIVGHSNGEFVALQAAGAFKPADDEALIRSIVVGAELAARASEPGLLPEVELTAAEGVDRHIIRRVLEESEGGMVLAIDNCPHQVVLAGNPGATARARESLQGKGGLCQKIPIRALHTESFAPACDVTAEIFREVSLETPEVELWSCTSAARYPTGPAAMEELTVRQLRCPVRFRETVEAMYEAGIRVFVEVGPRGMLSSFISDTLGKKPHAAVPLDVMRRGGVEQLCRAVGMLVAHGVPVGLPSLYARRDPARLDLTAEPPSPPPLAPPLDQSLPELTLGASALASFRISDQPSIPAASSVPPMPEPLAPPIAPPIRPDVVEVAAEPPTPARMSPRRARPVGIGPAHSGDERLVEAVAEHERTMRLFLDVQERVASKRFRPRAANGVPKPEREAALNGNGHGQGLRNGPPPTGPGRIEDATGPRAGRHPMLDAILSREPDRRLVAEIELDPIRHPFLEDHTFFGHSLSANEPGLAGLPIMPLAMTLELMAEAAIALRPGLCVAALRDVRAHRWLAFEDHARRVRVEATAESGDIVRVVVAEADSDEAGSPIAEGVVELAASTPELGAPSVPDAAVTPFPYPAGSCDYGHSQGEVYGRLLFHGPAFRTIGSLDASDRHATRATILDLDPGPMLPDGLGRDLTLPVALIDASGQVATCAVIRDWTEEEVQLSFPTALDRVEFAPRRDRGGKLQAVARVAVEPSRVRSDLEIAAEDGRIVLRVLGRSEALFRLPGDFYRYWSSPRRVVMSRPLLEAFRDIPGAEHVTVCEVGRVGGRYLVNRLWSRVLARMILGLDERRAFDALALPPVPTVSWLLGRVAAKDAVRLRLSLDACMADVAILAGEHGRPRAHLASGVPPLISLAHKGLETAVAVAGDPLALAGVGIDVEPLGPVDSAVKGDSFTEAEHAEVASAARASGEPIEHWYLAVWGAKEAVGKALGRGVLGGPLQIEARAIEPRSGRIAMALRGAMADAFPEYAGDAGRGPRIDTHRRILGDDVITLCLLPRGA